MTCPRLRHGPSEFDEGPPAHSEAGSSLTCAKHTFMWSTCQAFKIRRLTRPGIPGYSEMPNERRKCQDLTLRGIPPPAHGTRTDGALRRYTRAEDVGPARRCWVPASIVIKNRSPGPET